VVWWPNSFRRHKGQPRHPHISYCRPAKPCAMCGKIATVFAGPPASWERWTQCVDRPPGQLAFITGHRGPYQKHVNCNKLLFDHGGTP
jgi:hypothetical protein